jgi:hypothetical protein
MIFNIFTSPFLRVQTWQYPAESQATRQEAFKAIDNDLIPISGAGDYCFIKENRKYLLI